MQQKREAFDGGRAVRGIWGSNNCNRDASFLQSDLYEATSFG